MFNNKEFFYFLLCSLILSGCNNSINQHVMYSTAFYYGQHLPIDSLARYQRIVVEPENTSSTELASLKKQGAMIYAYLSVGEVAMDSSLSTKIDQDWILGINKDWNTSVMDMSHNGWRDFLVNYQVNELFRKGYQGLFLDTMDSYQLFTNTSIGLSTQQLGIITLIKTIKQKFPSVHFLFNRGFEVLDETASMADGVVAESLFFRWNPSTSRYQEVTLDDREWLNKKLTMVRDDYNLPVTVIDYLPMNQMQQAIDIAKKIKNLGFTPWVSSMELNSMGIGSPDLVP